MSFKFKLATVAGAAAAVVLATAPGVAGAATLTFDASDACSGGCSDYGAISQTYGDIAGKVDVQYSRSLSNPGPLSWWSIYGDLPGVAWGEPNAIAEVFLRPLAGFQVTLLGFDLGSYGGADRRTQVTLLGANGDVLGEFPNLTVGAVHASFASNLTRSDGIRIQWGPDAYDVGIDNIAFEVTALAGGVPEPATWAMMILGFGVVGAAARSRARVLAA
ncbi:PEPxxWA-CTERM sorting domain-containing protein [Phenylobacterium sp.]|uniref:PEPxxWA-CTERM sorting domain-containing protein n=1 Tax=Phenylobacterium sp. TaxID=1871053 RepID=UPI003D2C147D